MSIESSTSIYFGCTDSSSPVFLSSSAFSPINSPNNNNNIYLSTISTNDIPLTNSNHIDLNKNNIEPIMLNNDFIQDEKSSPNSNKSIKTFFRLLKPSVYKKRSKKIHLKSSSSFNNSTNNEPKVTVTRSNTKRSQQQQTGVLIANPLVNNYENSNTNMILYRNRMSLNRKKLNQASLKLNKSTYSTTHTTKLVNNKASKINKAKRAFSMMTPSSNKSTIEPLNNNNNNNNKTYDINTLLTSHNKSTLNTISKELTWYKLEELDNYYKILGNQ
jgi:hypothetical protein